MSTMRLMEQYSCQELTDVSYVWGGVTYSNLLIRDTLGTSTRITSSHTLAVGNGSDSTSTTLTWILPRLYKFNTIIDGVAAGSVRVKLHYALAVSLWMRTYFVISILSIDSAGTVTTLGTITTNTYYSVQTDGGYYTVDIPFWIDVFGKEVPNGSRIAMRVEYHVWCQDSSPFSETATAEMTLNSDDTYIQLPIVP